ncbi:MAG: hypothetical protein WCD42_12205 [Rhizomicrobium sp.]
MSSQYAGALSEAEQPNFCQTIDEFYARDARRLIFRLTSEFCLQNRATATELLHSADLLNKLENAGTAMLHAVQIQSSAYSSAMNIPVRDALNHYNRLISRVVDRVTVDHRKHVFPTGTVDNFVSLADSMVDKPNGLYLLNGTLVHYLRHTTRWSEKVDRLLQVLEAPGAVAANSGPGAAMLHSAVDEIVAEILPVPVALTDLIGPQSTFGEGLIAATRLFLGQQQKSAYTEDVALNSLARHFAAGGLPLSRAALGARLVADVQSLKRLREDSIEAEMRVFRELALLIRHGVGPYMKREEMMPALELRAARFVAHDTLTKCLDATTIPDEKIAWLYFTESCIVGARSRYKVADQIFRIATSSNFRNRVQSTQIPISKRLHILSGLCTSALKSGFDPDQRVRMAKLYDGLAFDIAQKSRLFENIDALPITPALKVQAMLKLFAAGQITEGKLSADAHKRVLDYLAQPGFLTGYLQAWAQSHGGKLDKMASLLELAQGLKKIGLPPDTFFNAMAA